MPVLAKHAKSFELINCTQFSANSSVGIHKRNLLKPRVVVATYSAASLPWTRAALSIAADVHFLSHR